VPVYFLGEDKKGCSSIKIGVAKDIARRKRALQTGNPLELRLLGWIVSEDDFQLERDLHSASSTSAPAASGSRSNH